MAEIRHDVVRDAEAAGWMLVEHEPLQSMSEARKAADELAPGRWKWAKPSGDCKNQAYRQCNAHVDCPLIVGIKKQGSHFWLYTKGKHGTEVNLKKRKNSSLTFEEEEFVRASLDMGNAPAEQLVALTKKKIRSLKDDGEDVEAVKNAEGGLQGEKCECEGHRHAWIHVSCMYPNPRGHKIHVFHTYPVREHIRYTYPKCIPNVSHT